MKKYICLLLLGALISSCTQRTQVREEYKIISTLYDSLAQRIPIPPPGIGIVGQKDSLRIMRAFTDIRDSLNSVKQIVAVNPYMEPVHLDSEKFSDEQKKLVIQLNSLSSSKPLNVDKIHTLNNDSIVPFENLHLRKTSADFNQINRLISYSRIAINSSGTEAALVVTTGTSRLDQHTAIYFLKKISNKWYLREFKILSIS